MSATPQLRPLRVGEVLDAAIKIYTRNAGQLFRIVLVVLVPFQILAGVVLVSEISGASLIDGQITFFSTSDLNAYNVSVILLGLVLVPLVALLASAACFKAVSDTYLGDAPRWRESLGFAFRRFGSVLWLTLLTAIILALAFVALIIPSVYLAFAFSVALPVLLVERIGGFKALGRSRELVSGRWWPTFGTLLVAGILVVVIQFVLGFIIGLIFAAVFSGDGGSPVLVVILRQLATTLERMVSIPFYAACVTVIYYDLRVRKEGYDLQLLAEAIGRSAPASGDTGTATPAPATPTSPSTEPEGLPSGQEPTGLERPGSSTSPPPPSG